MMDYFSKESLSFLTDQTISYKEEALRAWRYLNTFKGYEQGPSIRIDWTAPSAGNITEGKEYFRLIHRGALKSTWAIDNENQQVMLEMIKLVIYHPTLSKMFSREYRLKINPIIARVLCWHTFIHEFLHYITVMNRYGWFLNAQEATTDAEILSKNYSDFISFLDNVVGGGTDENQNEEATLSTLKAMIIHEFTVLDDIIEYNSLKAKELPYMNIALGVHRMFTLMFKATQVVNTNKSEYNKCQRELKKLAREINEYSKLIDTRIPEWRE